MANLYQPEPHLPLPCLPYSLHLAILRRLSSYSRLSDEERVQRDLPSFDAILEPVRARPRSINDFSPLVAAFDMHDKKVMSTLIMATYTINRWAGAGTGAGADTGQGLAGCTGDYFNSCVVSY